MNSYRPVFEGMAHNLDTKVGEEIFEKLPFWAQELLRKKKKVHEARLTGKSA